MDDSSESDPVERRSPWGWRVLVAIALVLLFGAVLGTSLYPTQVIGAYVECRIESNGRDITSEFVPLPVLFLMSTVKFVKTHAPTVSAVGVFLVLLVLMGVLDRVLKPLFPLLLILVLAFIFLVYQVRTGLEEFKGGGWKKHVPAELR